MKDQSSYTRCQVALLGLQAATSHVSNSCLLLRGLPDMVSRGAAKEMDEALEKMADNLERILGEFVDPVYSDVPEYVQDAVRHSIG